MIALRKPEELYQIDGAVENGTFHGRWHFSFGDYDDPKYIHFGTLRVFNDDTLSPGATWPLHPHRDNEVVTYCVSGEFRHADERGKGGVLKKGWVQHTTVGRGMWHSEINNLPDKPMRFIQMWFFPEERGREPSVEQKAVDRKERTNRLLPLVSNRHSDALRIISDAEVYASFIQKNQSLHLEVEPGRGVYFSVLEGGPVEVNGMTVPATGAALVQQEKEITLKAAHDSEVLLLDVKLV